jgi:hypothetical protein
MTEDFVKVFEGKEAFEAHSRAERWCQDNGISYSSTCVSSPQALLIGDFAI